jgi:hypothetical protein
MLFFIKKETEDVHAYGRPREAGFLANLVHVLGCLAQSRPATGSVFLRNREEEAEGAALDFDFRVRLPLGHSPENKSFRLYNLQTTPDPPPTIPDLGFHQSTPNHFGSR